jgi:hypothetical protein
MVPTPRTQRDGLIGALVSLGLLVQEFIRAGNDAAAAATLVAMLLVFVAYRYLDAKTLEAIAPDDADELKPILRRVGRAIRRRVRR